MRQKRPITTRITVLAGLLLVLLVAGLAHEPQSASTLQSLIVQGDDLDAMAAVVEDLGGTVSHRLPIISSIGADLTEAQLFELRGEAPHLRLYPNYGVEVDGDKLPTHYPALIDAQRLHQEANITGEGVTVAVLDTGLWNKGPLIDHPDGFRVLAQYDVHQSYSSGDDYDDDVNDPSGHGSHVTSVIMSSEETESDNGVFQGVAPYANLVVVQAFNGNGQSTYLDVIQGLDWILEHKNQYDIRVLNLSFSAEPRSFYWDDPLNQAVMQAWAEGIVVVASAGNVGPDPMTIGVPGNVPYVITVGAVSDFYTPDNTADDFLTSFSSAGPTYEGFVKPEVVAPGGHLLGWMPYDGQIAEQHPEFRVDDAEYYVMSGTSQAAAVASGVAALMLEANPSLTPDDVKCRMMAAARPAVADDGQLAYSVFQQGAGLVNAWDAVFSNANDCANQGMDVNLDLLGVEHYRGRANQNAAGDYYLEGLGDGGECTDGDGVSSSGGSAAVLDTFTSVSYENNDTDTAWASAWLESDPRSGGAASGNVRIKYGKLRMNDRPNSGTKPHLWRGVDLSDNVTSAVLSFNFRTSKYVDTTDKVQVGVSSDGFATFTILETFENIAGKSSGSRTFDITQFATADTAIGFRVSRNYGGRGETFSIDQVQVAYEYESNNGGAGGDGCEGGEQGSSEAGYVWNGGFLWNDGFLWADGFLWNDGFLWADGFLWNDGFLWADGFLWNDGFLWADGLTETMSINVWVDQE